MIIAFFGPDGSGKTTIARALALYFKRKGYKVTYVRLRAHHLAMYFIIKIMQIMHIIPRTSSPRILELSLKRIFGKSSLFMYLESLNVLLWLVINIKLRSKNKNRIIIAERYIPDFLVSLGIISIDGLIMMLKSSILKIIIKEFLEKADSVHIFLYASPQSLVSRKKDELLSIRFMRILTVMYVKIVKFLKPHQRRLLCIDTSLRSPSQTFSQVIRYITYSIEDFSRCTLVRHS